MDETEATEATTDEKAVDTTKSDEAPRTEAPAAAAETEATAKEENSYGVGQGAGAVVSAALGVVSLTGSWMGTVAAARQNLIGQLETAQNASVAKQIQAVYGDAWQTTALWGGLFALIALVVGVVVLARPAFGTPGRIQAPWIKSVAWAGVALGVIGLFLAVLKYTGVLLGLPSAS
ncbi:membrane protein [Streptomyces olindensis]|nr:membrane protein [Streptomyces olindensis]